MSLITVSVALGLALNRRKNPEVPQTKWTGRNAPRVEIIIPVRDEERNIGPLLDTLCAQDYQSEQVRAAHNEEATPVSQEWLLLFFLR